jgi:hypothetical protein
MREQRWGGRHDQAQSWDGFERSNGLQAVELILPLAGGTDVLGTPVPIARTLALMNDPARVFLTSNFVRLEVLPKPFYFHWQAEVDFYKADVALVTEIVGASSALVGRAYAEAQQVGLAGMDAPHIAAAKASGVEGCITTERRPRRSVVSRTSWSQASEPRYTFVEEKA